MMEGMLIINGIDALATWGIDIEDGGISALLTPAPAKDYITNNSRIEHGVRLVNENPRYNSRQITIPIYLLADSQNDFFEKYYNFCKVLEGGKLEISLKIKGQENVVYKCYYQSCTQFQQLMYGMAKFSLKLIEPDPTDRTKSNPTDESKNI